MPTRTSPSHASLLQSVLLAACLLVAPAALTLRAQQTPTNPATPPAPAAPSLIPNSNMETDSTGAGWPDGWPQLKGGGSWETEKGNHFIRLTSTTPDQMVMLYREVPIPAGVKALQLSFRWRVTNLKHGEKSWYRATIMLGFLNADHDAVSPDPRAPATGKDIDDWQAVTTSFLVPDGATALKLMPSLFRVASGTMDIDDVILTPIDSAAPQAAADAAAAAKAAKLAASAERTQAKAAETLKADGSLITDGDFETAGKGDSPAGWSLPGGASLALDGKNHFVELKSSEPGQMVMLYRPVPIPAGTKALELSWRWNVTNLKPGKMPWFDARIMLQFNNAAGQKTKDQPGAVYTRGTKGWEPHTTSFLVPPDAVTLVLMPALFQVTQGTMDIDDFVLKPTDTTALDAAAATRAKAQKMAYVAPETADKAKWPLPIHVQGNRIVDSNGKDVWLQGVNADGMESTANGTQQIKSTQVAIDDWHANVVRLPVKAEFWFGQSPFQKDGGKAYRDQVDQCVMIAANRGAYLLFDLHRFRAPTQADVDFWKDAAVHYANNPAVLFDIFNEPNNISWKVWRDGGFVGTKSGVDESAFQKADEQKKEQGFDSVGMQALVDVVRSTGAKNVILADGCNWSNDQSGVVNGYALDDKGGDGIMYGWHTYNWHKGWAKILPVAAKYPILVGEFGADIEKMGFIPLADQEDPNTWVPDMLGFLQLHHLNWTAWCLHPHSTPRLILDWTYTPTPFYGTYVKEALAGKQFNMTHMR